jgi:fucose permease
MEFYGINAAQQGFILTMQSVGALCTAIFIALKGEKYNKINSIAFGLLIICLAGAVIGGAPPYAALLVLVAFMGIGVSFIDIMMNGVISDVYPKQKNTLLPLVHAFFSVGATMTPIFVTMLANPNAPTSFSYPFRLLGVGAAAVFILYLLSGRRIVKETPYINMEAMKKRAIENPAEIFKTGKAWYFLVAGMLYFTFLMGTMMWLPTYAMKYVGADFETGGMMLTAFFAGSLLMRFLGPLILRRLTARSMYVYFGMAATVLMIAALFSESIPLMLVLVAVSGFLQGSTVATFILMCCEAFPERTASASSIFSISSNIASLTGPLWIGALSEYTGFRLPMVLINCAFLVSAAMIFIQGRRK